MPGAAAPVITTRSAARPGLTGAPLQQGTFLLFSLAAAACAVVLPSLVSPVIDLSVFTHSLAPVPLRPDLAAFLLPLAVLLVISVVAVAYEVRAERGRGVTATLRM